MFPRFWHSALFTIYPEVIKNRRHRTRNRISLKNHSLIRTKEKWHHEFRSSACVSLRLNPRRERISIYTWSCSTHDPVCYSIIEHPKLIELGSLYFAESTFAISVGTSMWRELCSPIKDTRCNEWLRVLKLLLQGSPSEEEQCLFFWKDGKTKDSSACTIRKSTRRLRW